MRAATIRDGKVFVEEHPDPVAGAGQVLVRVRGAGLNGADQMQLAGRYPAPPGSPPDIPGLELAGVVEALGDGASRFEVGDRVMGIVGGGGQAELAVVHERQLMRVPGASSSPTRAACPRSSRPPTTRSSRRRACDRASGCSSTARPGGVGTAAVQLAHAAGAHVTATVRNAGHARRCRFARRGRGRSTPRASRSTARSTSCSSSSARRTSSANLKALATNGRIVVIGVGAGAKAELNLLALMSKRARIMASTLRARPLEEKALTARAMEREVLPLFERGAARVPVAETFALDDVAAAYERFAGGGKLGKIILVP